MSYSQYKTIEQVQKEFEIFLAWDEFVTPHDVAPSDAFLGELQFSLKNIDYTSEAARSELFISPLLREIYKKYYKQYSFWIQKPLVYDETLTGVPDYLISKRSPLGQTVLTFPLIVVIEAKKNDFDLGWGQCLAELVAVQKLNEDFETPVYGIVTDGQHWHFGKLTENIFTRQIESYPIAGAAELFGALDYVLYTAGKQFNILSN